MEETMPLHLKTLVANTFSNKNALGGRTASHATIV
jgi:hypothetical protein